MRTPSVSCPIQGVTWTGLNDDVEALDKALDAYNARPVTTFYPRRCRQRWFHPPFLYPEKKWDFRLKVGTLHQRIGHKFGLVYPGLGWVCWKGKRISARRNVIQRKLPRCQHYSGRFELLPSCRTDSGSILPVHPFGIPGLQRKYSTTL